MRRAVILALLSMTGCEDDWCIYRNGQCDEAPTGGIAGGDDDWRPPSVQGLAPSHGGCGSPHCPIVIGGSDLLTIYRGDTRGLDVQLEPGGVELSAFPPDATEIETVATARDRRAARLHLTSDNLVPFEDQLVGATLTAVRLFPALGLGEDTALAVFSLEMRELVISLHGDSSPIAGLPGQGLFTDRVVDAGLTVELSTEGMQQLAWDKFLLPPKLGSWQVTAHADSFGTRTFDVEIVDGIDRIEGVLDRDLKHPGDRAIACFHAFHEDREVATSIDTEIEGATTSVGTPAQNCTYLNPAEPGPFAVTASALGVSIRLDFTLEP